MAKSNPIDPALLEKAVDYIRRADGLLITGGAGMGVDSGLPDFRGEEGFWRAYPALKEAGIPFVDVASPDTFRDHPERAWGFYGHRLNLYRRTQPHDGFRLLREMGERRPQGYFVFTSNVDGHYQKSGFDPSCIIERHGSINHLRCLENCMDEIWSAADVSIQVDDVQCLARKPLPACPYCGGLARPNILMFDDYDWNARRCDDQKARYDAWLASVGELVIIECGAGTAIPSVRRQGDFQWGKLIRINPNETDANKPSAVCIPAGALKAIEPIYRAIM